jgi:hypothetical protein
MFQVFSDGGFLPKAATRKSELRRATGRGARRTMLGDDGNQIGAHSALRNPNSALERLFSGVHFGTDDRAICPCLNPSIER